MVPQGHPSLPFPRRHHVGEAAVLAVPHGHWRFAVFPDTETQ
jgi:hypothetical protein